VYLYTPVSVYNKLKHHSLALWVADPLEETHDDPLQNLEARIVAAAFDEDEIKKAKAFDAHSGNCMVFVLKHFLSELSNRIDNLVTVNSSVSSTTVGGLADPLEDLVAWTLAATRMMRHWLTNTESCAEIGQLFGTMWSKLLSQPTAKLGSVASAGNNDEAVLKQLAHKVQEDIAASLGVKKIEKKWDTRQTFSTSSHHV
jgi:hypothetical protein